MKTSDGNEQVRENIKIGFNNNVVPYCVHNKIFLREFI